MLSISIIKSKTHSQGGMSSMLGSSQLSPVGCEKCSDNLFDQVDTSGLKVLQLLMAAGQQMPLLFLSMPQSMVSLYHAAFCQPWILL